MTGQLADGDAYDIARHIREVPDFPRKGVSFKDVTPLIDNGPALHAAVEALARATEKDGLLLPEARGFVFGTALAYRARKGLFLPRKTISVSYDLEYGSNTLEVHANSIPESARVLVVDDLLATGGTASAMCRLVEDASGVMAATA